ncbi:MAG: ABC transporter ATP-binding protein [Rhodocyclaceae bacterium]|nr:ABC transporter ATP-binding protein [Rhodocyclaceae bacterium]
MLAIEGLGYRYPGARQDALHDITLRLAPGEILGLLGPNGAGKSTLAAHLGGLLPIQRGGILLDGQPLAAVRRAAPRQVALAPQAFAFYEALTVRENLDCFGALVGAAASVPTALANAGLEALADHRAGQLSGGQKRRLNLAIALLGQPRLLILDEPTTGVDPHSRRLLIDRVRALAEAGMAVIYTSHYLEEVEQVATRVAMLQAGHLRLQAPMDALRARALLEVELADPPAADPAASLAPLRLLHSAGRHLTLELTRQDDPLAVLARIEQVLGPSARFRYGHSALEHLFHPPAEARP